MFKLHILQLTSLSSGTLEDPEKLDSTLQSN